MSITATIHLNSFEYWIEATRYELRTLAKYSAPIVLRSVLEFALFTMKHALRAANVMGCSARKALCMRVLNWINADLRRLS